MPAVNPRLNLTINKEIYGMLERLASTEKLPLAETATRLLETALQLGEDLVCGEVAAKRLKSFRRDDALSTENLLKWNRPRKA